MLSIKAVAVLREHGISRKELENAYINAEKEAKRLWRYGCIQKNEGRGIPKLLVQIGFNEMSGVLYRALWVYSNMTWEAQDWYTAKKVNLIDLYNSEPFNASDYLYENVYYKRTGCISDNVIRETAKNCPMNVESFDNVVEELAQLLS